MKSRIEKGAEYSHDITVGSSLQELQLLHTLFFALPLFYHDSMLRLNIIITFFSEQEFIAECFS